MTACSTALSAALSLCPALELDASLDSAYAVAGLGPREPQPTITVPWLIGQLVPSVGLALRRDDSALALSWQATPLLWSGGIDPRLTPWRSFVVEPIVRQSGSLELFVAGDYFGFESELRHRLGGELGVRGTLPVLERGDGLAVSFATSFFSTHEELGIAYEVGLHVLFGFLGVTVGPYFGTEHTTVRTMMKVRVF